jgi:tetratricopeptide (TPR) repeat protein
MTSQYQLSQALSFHQNGALAKAEQLYLQILSGSRNFQAQYLLAVLRHQQKRWSEALQAVEAALELEPDAIDALVLNGILLSSVGRFKEALANFDKVLARKPEHREVWGYRGAALTDLKRFDEALQNFNKALVLNPGSARVLFNRAGALQSLKRFEEALVNYDEALVMMPDYSKAWSGRGRALQSLKRFEEALVSYDKALALTPDDPKAWSGRAIVLLGLNRFEEASVSCGKALAVAPGYAGAWHNLALALRSLQRFDEAINVVDRALELRPDHPPTLFLRGTLLCEVNRLSEGFAVYARHAQLTFEPPDPAADPPHKQRHDREQRDYLTELGIEVLKAGPYLTNGERVETAAVNSANADDIAVQWQKNRPQVAVVDNFLTAAALDSLRRFCWGSTVWRRSYADGYLGAMPEYGFACPLLAQIAEELSQIFPTTFEKHKLQMWWGFKYDSSLSGIRLHADDAAVNVNFWITPDNANRNPDNGGLVIWDANAPEDWEIARYNGDEAAGRDFLARAGARSRTVPYRANRAVIFDSDLFHETDKIEFKEGYLNRRINITMLYGRRAVGP